MVVDITHGASEQASYLAACESAFNESSDAQLGLGQLGISLHHPHDEVGVFL